MKLSKTQESLLRKLWETGSTIYFMAGLNSHFFVSQTHDSIRSDTVHKLIDFGLLDKQNEDWRGYELILNSKSKFMLSRTGP